MKRVCDYKQMIDHILETYSTEEKKAEVLALRMMADNYKGTEAGKMYL